MYDARIVALTIRYAKNVLARAQRLLGRSFEARGARTRGPFRDTGAIQLTAWLSDDELREVNRHIGLLAERMKPTRPSAGKRLISLTLGLAPFHPSGGK
ncbi:MAG: hypothetical protein DHS20C14_01880 [Phycisphaeraceae bacterium]|nr:MAG: hypothetical protein DHS20C14_01880 [Phycisphaeraceae bacterium]